MAAAFLCRGTTGLSGRGAVSGARLVWGTTGRAAFSR